MLLSILVSFAALLFRASGDQYHAENHDRPRLNFSDTSVALDGARLALPGPEIAWTDPAPAPATDAVWKKFICKGKKMVAQMSYSDFDVGQLLPVPRPTVQSRWSKGDLLTWGYHFNTDHWVDYCDFSSGGFWGVSDLLREFSWSDKCVEDGGKWRAGLITHYEPWINIEPKDQTYRDPYGVERRVTGGFHHMAVYPRKGIMTQYRQSPWETLQKLHPWDFASAELPALQRSSDMMWAMWEEWVPEDRRHDLEFFMTLSIINEVTISLIKRALDNLGVDLRPEGEHIDMETDEGKAILSSPNGAGFAHFLIERKNQVGLKRIESVLVFQCRNKSKSPCLLFTVDPVRRPVPRPKDDGPVQGPRPDDPNTRENSNNPWKDHLFPPQIKRGATNERNILREHVFRMDAKGNLTWTKSFK